MMIMNSIYSNINKSKRTNYILHLYNLFSRNNRQLYLELIKYNSWFTACIHIFTMYYTIE